MINEAESRSFVLRQGGRLSLTDEGFALFKGEKYPQIFEVQARTEKTGFDLIGLAPCDRDELSVFELGLPELEIRDEQLAARASSAVHDSFWRFYPEIVGRKERDASVAVRRSLYSVDEVIPGDRFSSIVPVLAISNVLKPSEPEPVLDAWRSGHELVERSAIVNAVAAFVGGMKCQRRPEDDVAYQVLRDIAPDYLKDYERRRDGISVERFFRDSAGKVGELRIDRRTVGVVGPLYSPDNSNRVIEALTYSAKPEAEVSGNVPLLWMLPGIPSCGAPRALVTLLGRIGKESDSKDAAIVGSLPNVFAVSSAKPSRYLSKAFPKILVRPDTATMPLALEILLLSGRFVAVIVHAPLGAEHGFPVPLGILSFESDIVMRAQKYLEGGLPRSLYIAGSGEFVEWRSLITPSQDATT